MTTLERNLQKLSDHTIDKLDDLIEINLDSKNGFDEAAEKIDCEQSAALFRDISAEREGQARVLQQEVRGEGKEPETDGSFRAQAHRWWITVRDAFSSNDKYAVFAECERGEDKIKDLYEDVLKDTAGSPVNDVLQRQYAQVKQRHDQIRDLRDRAKNN